MKVVLDKDAIMPTRAHESDAGYDLYCKDARKLIMPGTGVVFDTGVHVELPKGTAGLLVSKSGLNVNHGILSTGLIDAGYTGPIKVKLYNHGNHEYLISYGDKISQLVIINISTPELELADKLDSTDRGDSGFGSTGK